MAYTADAGAQPRLATDCLEPLYVGLPNLGKTTGGQHFAVDVLHDPRQVADRAVGVDDAGLLATRRAIADELHTVFSVDDVS